MERRLQFDLPRQPDCAAIARRHASAMVGSGLSSIELDDLKLVVTELVENGFRHGSGQIRLTLERQPERVRVEVSDEGEGAAIKIREEGAELGGWGLRLVDQLSVAWGAYEGTTNVWADLPVRPLETG
jgi:anti-sigma regulatory factor (Ser/Thr protein kinase)